MRTWASVDLPEPFGPMIACTLPLSSVEVDAAQDLGAVDRRVQIADAEVWHAVLDVGEMLHPNRIGRDVRSVANGGFPRSDRSDTLEARCRSNSVYPKSSSSWSSRCCSSAPSGCPKRAARSAAASASSRTGSRATTTALGTTTPGVGAQPAAAELHAAAVVHAAPGVRPARPDAPRERVTAMPRIGGAEPDAEAPSGCRMPAREGGLMARIKRAKPDDELTLVEHLDELRTRLIVSISRARDRGVGLLLRERPHLPPAQRTRSTTASSTASRRARRSSPRSASRSTPAC